MHSINSKYYLDASDLYLNFTISENKYRITAQYCDIDPNKPL